ncbi:zinc finger protein Helios isoform X3 [Gouania willdenowi]|uniref:zinc finger protein Helios isoform X3 n=1 Tax=Gouania willdenowi TaxID=441366 RepID=UPI0010542281|nr:zinc finger protein Helios-like isoform X3 [Gouania willdenowi]
MEASEDYGASNGQCSPSKENSRMLADMSAPNGQAVPLAPNSPGELTIKQEEEITEETENCSPGHGALNRMDNERVSQEESMTGSPGITQESSSGSNVAGEAGNRQTNVGKPHKCNYCGRSYKQRTSLEEHKERCHSYLQSIGLDPTTNAVPYTGEGLKEARSMAEANNMASFDRPPVIERLHSNLGKRKSTTPQKFVGEKLVRYSFPDVGYEMGLKYEKHGELMPHHMMDQAMNNAITYLGSDALRPMLHHPGPPLSMAEVVPIVNPLFHHLLPVGQQIEGAGNCDRVTPHPPPPQEFANHSTSNGPALLPRQGKPAPKRQNESPNSCVDSADSARSSPQDRPIFHSGNAPPSLRSQASPGGALSGERVRDASPKSAAGVGLMRVLTERSAPQQGVRVFGREGHELRAFQCEHCRVLFLDHVMYTIHMGCHGYRDPLECNICGHRSKDRYEFSSHIVRGEHTFQ